MSYQNHTIANEVTVKATAERREVQDRRHHSWRTLAYGGLHGYGRRRYARRNEYNYYLDWYDPWLVFTGIAVLVMSSMDAMLTLWLIDRGAHEANYLMARLMEETSDEVFLAVKLVVTALCMIFLLMHSHFRIWRIISGKQLIQTAAIIYSLLIGYELILLSVLKG